MSGLVAIIDYGSGNLRSAEKALARAAQEAGIDAKIAVTAKAEVVAAAERIVLPGVGAFGDCLAGVGALAGMRQALSEAVAERGVPFLGICVGMQLMAARGLEHGEHKGFGWIEGDVVRLEPADPSLKIPHMGWNVLRALTPHPVLANLEDVAEPHAYFVHSYHLKAAKTSEVLADTDYGGAVAAVVGRDNMIGTQFHPEKSQQVGLGILRNFLAWRP